MSPRIPIIVALGAALAAGCTKSEETIGDADADAVPDAVDADAPADATDMPEVLDAPDATDVVEDEVLDTIGMACANDEECQNGEYCDGAEVCPFGFCRAGPLPDCSDGVNCTLDTCNEETDSCDHEVDDTACDDSNPCTDDSCDVATDTCINADIDCSDTVNCTLDTCDTSTGDCVHTIADEACDDSDACTIDTCEVSTDTCHNTLIDGDGDLHPPESCGGDDCNDGDATIYTGATEICDDGIDQDCDGADEPPGSCDCPADVTLGSVYSGDTTGLPASYVGSCDVFGMSGSEAVHRLVLGSGASVVIDQYSMMMLGILYVKQTSCTGTEVGCVDYTVGLHLTLTAGTYLIFNDDIISGLSGTYKLVVREDVTPTAVTGNDDCSSAHSITADGSFGGGNSALTSAGDGSCATSTGGLDAWFTFTLSSAADVHLDTFGSDYDTVLYVRQSTCTGTEAGCNEEAGYHTVPDSALDLSLAAGTYYVIVDGSSVSDTGTYQLNVIGLP